MGAGGFIGLSVFKPLPFALSSVSHQYGCLENQLSVKVKIAEFQEGFWSWSRWKPTQTGKHYQGPSSAACDIFTCVCRGGMKAKRDALGSSGQSCAAA